MPSKRCSILLAQLAIDLISILYFYSATRVIKSKPRLKETGCGMGTAEASCTKTGGRFQESFLQ